MLDEACLVQLEECLEGPLLLFFPDASAFARLKHRPVHLRNRDGGYQAIERLKTGPFGIESEICLQAGSFACDDQILLH